MKGINYLYLSLFSVCNVWTLECAQYQCINLKIKMKMAQEEICMKSFKGKLPYLEDSVLGQFSNVIIKSEDGTEFYLNELLFVSWSKCGIEMIKDSYVNDKIIISSEYCKSELNMFCDFITKGILPCSIIDILNGKISPQLLNVFQSFGVDLVSKLSHCSFLNPSVKIEVPVDSYDYIFEEDPLILNNDDSFDEKETLNYLREETKNDTLQNYHDTKALNMHEDIIEKITHDSKLQPMPEYNSKYKKSVDNDKNVSVLLKCEHCDKSYKKPLTLTLHLRKTHGVEKTNWECEFCGKIYNNAGGLTSHRLDNHINIGNWGCDKCPMVFKTKTRYVCHIRSMHTKRPCKVCGKEFGVRQMRKHIKAMDCFKEQTKNATLQNYHDTKALKLHEDIKDKLTHESKHENNIEYEKSVDNVSVLLNCELCDKSYEKPLNLKIHLRNAHGVEKTNWECEFCGKVYNNAGGLTSHRLDNHIDIGHWTCDKCPLVFKTKNRYVCHVRSTHTKRPCEVCGKVFGARQMRLHILQEHTEDSKKPYICSVCNKGFIDNDRLGQHMNIHTGNKPFICQYCGKGFASKRNMKTHVKAHNGFKRKYKKKSVKSEKTQFIP